MESHWYAVYTRSRAEKKLLQELEQESIEAFLPLQRVLRKWSDRKKYVEVPALTGYIFVYITEKQIIKVRSFMHAVAFVRAEGKPAIIPTVQIDYLKQFFSQTEIEVETTFEKIECGQLVEVISGPFVGVKAICCNLKGKNKLVLQLDQLGCSFVVEISLTQVKPIV